MNTEKYIFALTATKELPDLSGLKSFGEQQVERLDVDGLSAVVTALPAKRLRPRRSNLRVHHQVIDYLIEQGASPLPFSFGAAAPVATLETFIEEHRQELTRRIEKVRGCVETTMKLQTKPGHFYEFLVRSDETLLAYRDALFSAGEPGREEKIELGRRVEAAREALAASLTAKLVEGLGEFVEDHGEQPPAGEDHLVHLVFLVGREKTEAFEQALEAVAATLDDDLVIHLSPYLAPYHFADVEF